MPFITTPERLARCESYLAGIEVSLEVKFGAEGLQLMPEIRELMDHEVLRDVLEAIRTADAPDELRRIWAPKRRPKKGRRT